MEAYHTSVLPRETIDALVVKPDGTYVDCTTGGGGHSYHVASRLTTGRLICIDQDRQAIAAARDRLAPFLDKITFANDNFENLDAILKGIGVTYIDGVLLDLGVSGHQLDDAERGFSYMKDAPLGMNMNPDSNKTAHDIVNGYSEAELRRVLLEWGEERFAGRIAAAIVREREKTPIERTVRLAEIIKSAIPSSARDGGHHPAKRSFQAIRIELNREIDIIAPTVKTAVEHLAPRGRIAVITFHSIEDRTVKATLAALAKGCTCPPTFPICICGKRPQIKLFKPITPSAEEEGENPRARSATLRSAERI